MHGRISEIKIAGENVTSATICPARRRVHVGMTQQQLGTLCGRPAFVNKEEKAVPVGSQAISEWHYDFGPYHKNLILEFLKGKLVLVKKA